MCTNIINYRKMEPDYEGSTAVCLIASAGNFDEKKAKAKMKNKNRKNG